MYNGRPQASGNFPKGTAHTRAYASAVFSSLRLFYSLSREERTKGGRRENGRAVGADAEPAGRRRRGYPARRDPMRTHRHRPPARIRSRLAAGSPCHARRRRPPPCWFRGELVRGDRMHGQGSTVRSRGVELPVLRGGAPRPRCRWPLRWRSSDLDGDAAGFAWRDARPAQRAASVVGPPIRMWLVLGSSNALADRHPPAFSRPAA
jgi:hypothetical protein